jgi:hypothetical protein
LDALLGTMELQLVTGGQPPAFSPDEQRKIQSDAAVGKLILALPPNSKERLQESVKALQELRQHTQTKQYLLKVFEANDRAKLGDPVTAKTLFIEVLRSQPLLTGAYKDLGDVFLMMYDTPHAWRCWDIGRRIVPKFGTFSSVAQFEEKLATDYPEYF